MLDRSLRPLKSAALAPAAAQLAAVPPTVVTALGLVVGLGSAGLAAAGWWGPALLAWLANRFIDGLDGEIARGGGTASDLGGYLDLVADAVVYAAVPLGVAAGLGTKAGWIAATILLGTFYVNIVTVTMLAAVLEKRAVGADTRGEQTTVVLPAGLVEGSETIVFIALVLALPSIAVWTMAAMAISVAATAVARVVSARSQLRSDAPVADHRSTARARR